MRRLATNLLIVCSGILLALIVLEASVRLGGRRDADGQFTFLHYQLEPYVLPVQQLRGPVQEYLDLKAWATVIYDSRLGWSFRPHATRQGGEFTVNGAGIRARREYAPDPPPDTLRIALFGDSFTAGDDVADDQVWGARLEELLRAAGIRGEALNFGVGAYGMGQAYLRWQHEGTRYAPDIVIFGLQPDNLKRNVNVFRQLLHASGPPFSKPRFTLDDGALSLVNSPTLPPEALIAAFEDFADHPLAAHEYWYQSRYAASNWWASSKLASLLYTALKQNDTDPDIYGQASEAGQLGRAILDAFAADVVAAGQHFIVVHLPLQAHLIWRFNGVEAPFAFLLQHARDSYHTIDFDERLHPFHVDDRYWSLTKHYGPELHALLADQVAEDIANCIREGACPLPRFPDLSAITIPPADADS